MDSWLLRKTLSDSPFSRSVPRWNYLLLRIQFFIMYFVAGLKKFEPDWLWGYSMSSLGHHHVFTPFRYECIATLNGWSTHLIDQSISIIIQTSCHPTVEINIGFRSPSETFPAKDVLTNVSFFVMSS